MYGAAGKAVPALLAAGGGVAVAGAAALGTMFAAAPAADCDQLPQRDASDQHGAKTEEVSPTSKGNAGLGSQEFSEAAQEDIPSDLQPIYQDAAKKYGIDAATLASIGKQESDHWRNQADGGSGYGASRGPMHFIDSTWETIGVDGNGDGEKDVYDPEDAIPSAAKYLRDSGAPDDYYQALKTYNQSDAYVQEVLSRADDYRRAAGEGGGEEERKKDKLAFGGLGSKIPPGLWALLDPGTARIVPALPDTLLSQLAMPAAHAAPHGWDLTNGDGELTYRDTSSFGDAVERAAEMWRQAGQRVREAPSGENPDVDITDSSQLGPGTAGLTSSDGKIHLNPATHSAQGSDQNAAMIAHEIGHGLGLGHTDQPGLMNYETMYNEGLKGPSEYDKRVAEDLHGKHAAEVPSGSPKQDRPADRPVPKDASPSDDSPPDTPRNGRPEDRRPDDRPSEDRLSSRAGSDENGRVVFPADAESEDKYSDDWAAPEGKQDRRRRSGTNIFAQEGSDVYSMTDGTVKKSPDGESVQVEAAGDAGGVRRGDRIVYSNVDPEALSDGQKVKAGQKIGKVRRTAAKRDDRRASGEGPEAKGGAQQTPEQEGRDPAADDHFNVGWYDPSGRRAEKPTGELNSKPLLDEASGKNPGGSKPAPDGEEDTSGEDGASPAGDKEGGAPRTAPVPCEPGTGGGAGGKTRLANKRTDLKKDASGAAKDLLENPNISFNPEAVGDLEAGIVDERLIKVLQVITEDHKLDVSYFKTGHFLAPGVPDSPIIPDGLYGTTSGGAPNTHYFGRAADIWKVDDKPVAGNPTDPDVIDVGKILAGLDPQERPDVIIGPTEWNSSLGHPREAGWIQDADQTELHNDHFHFGYWSENGTNNTK